MVVVGLLAGSMLRTGDVRTATIGSPAPDFSVAVIDGGSFHLSDHLRTDGRPVVLNLWASWCIPCREEIPEIGAFSRENPHIKVIGVAVDDTDQSATAFAREIRAPYDLALGDAAFEDAYPRIGLPVTYIIDRNGVVTDVFNGILDRQTLGELAAEL